MVDPGLVIYQPGTRIPVGALYYGDVPKARFFDDTSSTAQAAANCGNASREKWLHVPDMQKSRDQGRLAMPTGRK